MSIRTERGDLLREAAEMPRVPAAGSEIVQGGWVITVLSDTPARVAKENVDGRTQAVHQLVGRARPEIVPFLKSKKR